jgi:hypothetical protein
MGVLMSIAILAMPLKRVTADCFQSLGDGQRFLVRCPLYTTACLSTLRHVLSPKKIVPTSSRSSYGSAGQ